MLEPDVVKVASPVLRGLGAGNGLWLLGELVKSERQFVMNCIKVQNLPLPERVLTYQWCSIV